MIHRSGGPDALDAVDAPTAARIPEDLAAGGVQVRTDLTQYAETYYFREAAPEAALAVTLSHAEALARASDPSATATAWPQPS
ncbi:hypothetical protein [Isoptericola sp. NPDC057391]|uniref:hypothetical protein n=1 Tax=Isoptericola sp. NPDC057391 TaxID=3346117 RepID=UPI003638B04F